MMVVSSCLFFCLGVDVFDVLLFVVIKCDILFVFL